MSKKSLQKGRYKFDLYDISLSKIQLDFLQSNDLKKLEKEGVNVGAYKTSFRTALDNSLKTIACYLPYSKNFRTHELYEIFNAKSMEYVIQSLLQNPREPQSRYSHNYQYDFRTSELARMCFGKMVDYLYSFPEFKNQKEIIQQLIKPLSNYFEILSRATLRQENDELTIDKEEQQRIKEYLQKHDSNAEFHEYQNLKERNRQLIIKLYKLKIDKDLEPFRQKAYDQKGIAKNSFLRVRTSNREEEKSIKQEIVFNEEKIGELRTESFIREGHINRLSNVYNHLESFASRTKPLEEFAYLLSRIELQDNYIKDVDSKFKEDEAKSEFDDMMYEKYKTKKVRSKEPAIMIKHSKKNHFIAIPTKEYHLELRKFFKNKGLGDKFGTPKHYTVHD